MDTAPEQAQASAPVKTRSPLWGRVVMYGMASVWLLSACVVHRIAPEGATVEMPTLRYGREPAEVGLWALYLPGVLAVLAAWYATARLPRATLGKRRMWWMVLLMAGPAVLFAIVAYDALT